LSLRGGICLERLARQKNTIEVRAFETEFLDPRALASASTFG
jgi:hypothetical protein